MIITLNLNRGKVLDEVAKTTAYTGAKMDDEAAYERIFTTDEDLASISRFWDETCVSACEKLKKFLVSECTNQSGDYVLTLELSTAFDIALSDSMQRELFSFFVNNITGKWYAFTNKGEAGEYLQGAAILLEGVHRKACYKRRPKRPSYV